MEPTWDNILRIMDQLEELGNHSGTAYVGMIKAELGSGRELEKSRRSVYALVLLRSACPGQTGEGARKVDVWLRGWLVAAAEACEQSSQPGDSGEAAVIGAGLRRLSEGHNVDMLELQLHAICVTRMNVLTAALRPNNSQLRVYGDGRVIRGGRIPAEISDYTMQQVRGYEWWQSVLVTEINWASTIQGGVGLASPADMMLRRRGRHVRRFIEERRQPSSATRSQVEEYERGVRKLSLVISTATGHDIGGQERFEVDPNLTNTNHK